MEPSFWHERWQSNNINFHQAQANPRLVAHWRALGLPKGSRVFVPFCGKSLDLRWLAEQGCTVVGAELSPLAVAQFFEELGEKPEVSDAGKLKRWRSKDIEIYLGDLFDLQPSLLGEIDAVYDRAALVALPSAMRRLYATKMLSLCGAAPQLLVTYAYDQSKAEGPPFSVTQNEVKELYGAHFTLEPLATHEVEGGMRGKTPAQEQVWKLAPSAKP